MFKENHKDTRTLWTYFNENISHLAVCIVDFEHVTAGWVTTYFN